MQYIVDNFEDFSQYFLQHVALTVQSLLIALAIALPVGVLLTRVRWLAGPVLGLLGILYTIPSLSLLVLLIPWFGLGPDNAIVVLVIYAQIILVRNIVVGINGVDRQTVEAARGMGMNSWQRLWRVELPLALPVILAGVRIATVAIIGIATVAALIRGGGLGTLLFEGVSRNSTQRIIAGAFGAALLAGFANLLLSFAERRARAATHETG
jgi:osmoprotectant transport system permease protein